MRQIMAIIDKLDIRRPQVLVRGDHRRCQRDQDTRSSESTGRHSARASNVPAAAFVSPVGGTSIVDLAAAVQNPASVTATLLNGTTLGVGRIGSAAL